MLTAVLAGFVLFSLSFGKVSAAGCALLSAAGILLLAVCHGWRNNAMMAYVEQKAYDGTGMDERP